MKIMFKKGKNKDKKKHPLIKIIGLFGLFFAIFKNRKISKYFKSQGRELNELMDGDQDFNRFKKDSKKLLKNLFIPDKENDYKPRILSPKKLLSYVLIAVAVKLMVTGFLFASYPTPAELSAIVSNKMIELINEDRVEIGLDPLVENQSLATYARIKGQDMIDRNYFAHDTPEGKRPWEWIDRSDYDYVYAGENLAMDFVTAEVVHQAFMKSPSHRRNILNDKYKEIGVAVLEGEIDGRETILLVNFFGTKRSDVVTGIAANQPAEGSGTETAQEPILTNTNPDNVNSGVAGAATTDNTVAGPRTIEAVSDTPTPGPINEGVIVVQTSEKAGRTMIDFVIEYSNIFFLAFLIFMLISLALNVFINIKVQHSAVILQSVVVIALLASMLLIKLHFVENVAPQLLIL